MKILSCFALFVIAAVSAVFAQSRFDAPSSLSPEESQIISEFRRDPEPFRRVMLDSLQRPTVRAFAQEQPTMAEAVVGPRDVIDVVVRGGKIAFWGKRREYEPVSFRILRGEKKVVSFFTADSGAETQVTVVFKSDGLHFDVPEAFDGNPRHVQGLLVIPESDGWRRGDLFQQSGMLTSPRSTSKAETITVGVRYASNTGVREARR